mmetsp:Transcript_12365/g.43041  ORF Transcript_12365/g.43041 Transcript_12365/m.43041 type:complete len:88 (-) Transcript_12365:717-980(-)
MNGTCITCVSCQLFRQPIEQHSAKNLHRLPPLEVLILGEANIKVQYHALQLRRNKKSKCSAFCCFKADKRIVANYAIYRSSRGNPGT